MMNHDQTPLDELANQLEHQEAEADHVPLPRRRRFDRARVNVNLTSLIDVTFLLLIYFMVATSMTGAEEGYRMDLPGRSGAAAIDPFKLDEEPLRISITSTGLGPTMYRISIDGPYPQPATFQDLYAFLNSAQVNPINAASGGGSLFTPAHPIIIQPTRHTRWEHAIEALNAAVRAHYTNVTFAKPG